MNVYIEITLLPSADIGLYFLWEKVFQQIHLGLVEMQTSNGKVPIGISFPEYSTEKNQLGSKLRLFAEDETVLEALNAPKCLKRFTDYVHLPRIRQVPDKISTYGYYKRLQPKSSKERLARRKAKREGIEVTQALKILEGYNEQHVKNPFINMNSQSSEQRFKLFILKQEATDFINEGFSTYGLSQSSTVPEF